MSASAVGISVPYVDSYFSSRDEKFNDRPSSTIDLRLISKFLPKLDIGISPLIINKPDIVYHKCNEENQIDTIKILNSTPKPLNGLHIGVSTMFNYDIIATRASKTALFFDYNFAVLNYHRIILDTVLAASSREDFARLIISKMDEEGLFSNPTHGLILKKIIMQYFFDELSREGSWLSTDIGFNRVKDLHTTGNIFLLPLNAAQNTEDFKKLSDWISRNGFELDTLYLSNIHDWIDDDYGFIHRYKENISAIINKNTIVIDSSPSLHLHQRCYIGGVPDPILYSEKKLLGRLH